MRAHQGWAGRLQHKQSGLPYNGIMSTPIHSYTIKRLRDLQLGLQSNVLVTNIYLAPQSVSQTWLNYKHRHAKLLHFRILTFTLLFLVSYELNCDVGSPKKAWQWQTNDSMKYNCRILHCIVSALINIIIRRRWWCWDTHGCFTNGKDWPSNQCLVLQFLWFQIINTMWLLYASTWSIVSIYFIKRIILTFV